MSSSDSSSSGEITSSFENISDVFTSYSEIPSEGFNRLFRAQRYGKWFVIKGLKPEYIHKEVYLSLLTKEFELGIRMDHPNIAHIFSKETDPIAGPCIVMEYVDGITLKEFLKQNPPRKVRMKIAKELLSAMSYFHSLQIIHRDLKPDNILVTHNGHNIKIIDFGLADSDWHGVLKQHAGSDKYAAPEQKAGDMPIDCRADIFAFGKILRLLFPHSYGHIVRKCTQENREKRYSNAEEILLRLQRQQAKIGVLPIPIAILALLGSILLFKQHQPAATRNHHAAESADTNIHPSDSFKTHSKDTIVVQKIENKPQSLTIPQGALQMIEQCMDTTFEPFWTRYRAAENKLMEQMEYGRLVPNNHIYEEQQKAVLSAIIQRYPQCAELKEPISATYKKSYYLRMKEISDTLSRLSK